MVDERPGERLKATGFFDSVRRLWKRRSATDAAGAGDRPDTGDAGAAAAAQAIASNISHSAGPGYPPGYVKDYDDGRPRH